MRTGGLGGEDLMWNSNFLKMKRLWSGKDDGEITKNEKWESIKNLSREENGNQKKEKRKLRWEVFEESVWERGRGHFLEGMKSFSREDKKREREKKKKKGSGRGVEENRENGKRRKKERRVWEKSERSKREGFEREIKKSKRKSWQEEFEKKEG